jgi:hypothetical protein
VATVVGGRLAFDRRAPSANDSKLRQR